MFNTRLCRLLGIEHPIILGGMLWVGMADLVAAVSQAGGLGLLAAGGLGADQVSQELERVRQATAKPFGVNIPLVRPDAEQLIQASLEGGATVIVTSAGSPKRYTAMIKAGGAKALHLASNVTFARKSQDAGVDAVVAEGYEAGGHNGPDEITTMALVPQIADALDIPVVAAGGIADGRGMVAALALGAEAVQMGTRFLATHESAAHQKYKEAVVGMADNDTCVTGRTTIGPTRAIRNRLTDMIQAAEKQNTPPQELFEMIGEGRSARACLEGDVQEGSMYCGQIGGAVREIKSAAQVVADTMAEAREVLRSLGALAGL